jgi:hypothetical protein
VSMWGEIDAVFKPSIGKPEDLLKQLKREIDEREPYAPTGSESGPDVRLSYDKATVMVIGRLRDVHDFPDSPMVLAWFCRHADWCEWATLEWELDSGERYAYRYGPWPDIEHHELRRIQKGVLD